MKKLFIRSLVIVFWVALLMGCLYWPKLKFMQFDKRTINVFAWGAILEPSVIAQFEKEKNIKVRLSYYSSNEEMLVKLQATKGEGYDLIIPSDYAVNILIQEDLLKPIDKTKLTFWNELSPNLIGHYFDPQNKYSIPFEWEIFIFGIDKEYFAKHPLDPSWKLIFDPSVINYKIAMTNDPIEAVQFAGYYLFGPVKELNSDQEAQVKQLLTEQKKWVEAYASFRGDYFLATQNCPVVASSSSLIWKTMRQFPFVGFIVPKEGSFITIENLAIPIKSEKEELTYEFMNYIFSHESVKTHFESFGFIPATLHAIPDLELDPASRDLVFASAEQFKKFHFITELLPQQQIHDMWVEVKSGKY